MRQLILVSGRSSALKNLMLKHMNRKNISKKKMFSKCFFFVGCWRQNCMFRHSETTIFSLDPRACHRTWTLILKRLPAKVPQIHVSFLKPWKNIFQIENPSQGAISNAYLVSQFQVAFAHRFQHLHSQAYRDALIVRTALESRKDGSIDPLLEVEKNGKQDVKPTNPNADTYVEKQRFNTYLSQFPANPLVEHPGLTHWGDTLVWHPCLTLLRYTLVRHSCLTLWFDTLVGHSCLTLF